MNNIKKIIALLSVFIFIFLSAIPTFAKTKYSVEVKKTDIQADIAFNTDGYASLTKKYRLTEKEKEQAYYELTEYYLDDGENVEEFLQKNGFENIDEYYLDGEFTSTYFADYSALMDKNGKLIMPYTYALNSYYVSDSVISKGNWYNIYSYNDKDTNGYFDLSGNKLNKTDYLYSRNFSDGIAFVRCQSSDYDDNNAEYNDGKIAYLIDKNENIVLELPKTFAFSYGVGDGPLWFVGNYNFCGEYSEGLIGFVSYFRYTDSIFEDAEASEYRLCGYMDIEGNIIIPQQFYNGSTFNNGMAWVQEAVKVDSNSSFFGPEITGGKFGYINKSGELVIPFIYDDVSDFDGEYAVVLKDGKRGLINTKGETVIPFEYDIMAIHDGIITCLTDADTAPLTLMTVEKEIIWQTDAKNVDGTSAYDEGVLYYTKDGYVYVVSVIAESVPDNIKGDADGNGTINAADARLTLRASVGLETLTDKLIKIMDINKDNAVTAADARLILRAAVGLEDPSTW